MGQFLVEYISDQTLRIARARYPDRHRDAGRDGNADDRTDGDEATDRAAISGARANVDADTAVHDGRPIRRGED